MTVYVVTTPTGKVNVRTSNRVPRDEELRRGFSVQVGSLNWKAARAIAEWYNANKDDGNEDDA